MRSQIFSMFSHFTRGSFQLWIDPAILEYSVLYDIKKKYLKKKLVVSGDWDQKVRPLRSVDVYELIENIHNGNHGKVSAFFEERIDRGTPFNNNGTLIDSREQIVWYIEKIESLLESLRTEGFVPERGTRLTGVGISRDGAFLKTTDGRHRLIACQVLGLPAIKVRITNIHPDFLRNQSFSQSLRICFREPPVS